MLSVNYNGNIKYNGQQLLIALYSWARLTVVVNDVENDDNLDILDDYFKNLHTPISFRVIQIVSQLE